MANKTKNNKPAIGLFLVRFFILLFLLVPVTSHAQSLTYTDLLFKPALSELKNIFTPYITNILVPARNEVVALLSVSNTNQTASVINTITTKSTSPQPSPYQGEGELETPPDKGELEGVVSENPSTNEIELIEVTEEVPAPVENAPVETPVPETASEPAL